MSLHVTDYYYWTMADVSMIPTCSLCLQPVNLEKSYGFSRLIERGCASINRANIATQNQLQ